MSGWRLVLPNFHVQMSYLRRAVDSELQHGNSLGAWRRLLLLVLLHDPTTVKTGPLVPVSGGGGGVRGAGAGERGGYIHD